MAKAKKAKRAAKRASVKTEGAIPKLTLNMPLDARKIKAIQRCIERGQLTLTINRVDLATGKLGEAWLYD